MIANNHITTENIVRKDEKDFLLYDWGCSGVKESMSIRGQTFDQYYAPFCKNVG